jgi:hypothetical protein
MNTQAEASLEQEESFVKTLRRSVLSLGLALCCGLLALPAWGATPGFTMKASNVSMSDMGTGVSNFTLTSVNGFTGQVGVTCTGPDTNLLPDLVLPNCTFAVAYFVVPANGTVSGTMNFVPPNTSQAAGTIRALPLPGDSPAQTPLAAGAFAGVALLGLRFRRRLNRWPATIVLCAASLAALAGTTGCIGNGGLAMTPGTYSYVISAASTSASASSTISVTVH